jgi:hypothetical protein
MPFFESQYKNPNCEILGYYNESCLVAFSLVTILNDKNAEGTQFAWNYKNPELMLGVESLKNECAYYKQLGFDYYYLGLYNKYKEQFDGFEMVGK